jgi:magnesium transporter
MKIRHYLATHNASALRRLLARHNFADVADVMDNALSEEEAVQTFQYLNMGQAAQVLSSLNEMRQVACLSSLPALMGSKILRVMAVDDAVDILQEMDASQSRKILDEMPYDQDTRLLQHLLLEEPDTAGGIMSTDFVKTHIEGTVGDALALIKGAEEKDFIYYCYLVDSQDQLVGVVSLKKLILHDESAPLHRVATFDIKSLLASFDQELVANLFRKYFNLLAMPVVDTDNRLLGIITLDDIVDVIDEESSEDIYRASGISLEEVDEKNLLTGPMINAVKARLPWLGVTLIGQFLASSIIASFHETVSAATIAISFMPLLSGLSGNMGAQSETISVRGLALNLIDQGNIKEKLVREMRVAITTSLFFGVSVMALSFVQYRHWELSLLLFLSITVSLCLAAFLGMFLPYGLKNFFKQDPAGIGGPFITTLLDILTFTTYLYVITLLIERMI